MNSAKSPNQTNDDNDGRRQGLASAQEIVRAQVRETFLWRMN
jgi:hypothetical protein